MQKGARTLLERHEAKTTLKSQRGELSELYDDGDDGEIKATGVKRERCSQLPQTTMDDKESGKTGENEGGQSRLVHSRSFYVFIQEKVSNFSYGAMG